MLEQITDKGILYPVYCFMAASFSSFSFIPEEINQLQSPEMSGYGRGALSERPGKLKRALLIMLQSLEYLIGYGVSQNTTEARSPVLRLFHKLDLHSEIRIFANS
jgi:hypothetical protein